MLTRRGFLKSVGAALAGGTAAFYASSHIRRRGRTCYAVRSGDWHDPKTWDGGQVPQDGDRAVVSSGTWLVVERQAPKLVSIKVGDGTGPAMLDCVPIPGRPGFRVHTTPRGVAWVGGRTWERLCCAS